MPGIVLCSFYLTSVQHLILLTVKCNLINLRFWLVVLALHQNVFLSIYLMELCSEKQILLLLCLLNLWGSTRFSHRYIIISFYILPLAYIIQSFSDSFDHLYADDIQFNMFFKPHQLCTLFHCLTWISDWLFISQSFSLFCSVAKSTLKVLQHIFSMT